MCCRPSLLFACFSDVGVEEVGLKPGKERSEQSQYYREGQNFRSPRILGKTVHTCLCGAERERQVWWSYLESRNSSLGNSIFFLVVSRTLFAFSGGLQLPLFRSWLCNPQGLSHWTKVAYWDPVLQSLFCYWLRIRESWPNSLRGWLAWMSQYNISQREHSYFQNLRKQKVDCRKKHSFSLGSLIKHLIKCSPQTLGQNRDIC